MHFEDLHFAHRPYDAMLAYGQSKTANVLFAVEATRRWQGDGIVANALHPGAIAPPTSRATSTRRLLDGLRAAGAGEFKTLEQGAATSVLLATSPQLEGIGGRYFEDCNEAAVVRDAPVTGLKAGVAAYALDAGNAERLWDLSERLLA